MLTNRWLILAALAAARVSMGFQFQSVASTSSLLTEALGIGYTQVGTLIGLYMLPGVFLALPVGALGARFGDKRVISLGFTAMVFGGLIMGLGNGLNELMLGRVLGGAGSIALNVLVAKMVTDWFAGREIRLAMGAILSTWPIGIALGLLTQGSLAQAISWQAVMFATSGLSAFGLLLIVGLYRSPPGLETEDRRTMRLTLPRRQLLLVSMSGIAWAFFNVGYAIFFSFGPDSLQARGVSEFGAGVLISIGVWITMVSTPVGGYVTERWGHANLFIIIFSLLCAGVMGLFPFVMIPTALSILLGIFIGPPPGAMVSLPSEALTPENRGTGLGIFYTWFYLGMALGPAVAGLGRDVTGSAATPLLIGSIAFALVVPFLMAFRTFQGGDAKRSP